MAADRETHVRPTDLGELQIAEPLTRANPTNVVGVDFGGTKIAVGTRMADGKQVRLREEFPAHTPAEQVLSRARDLVGELLGHSASPDVVAISTPGVVVDNQVMYAPNVDGWETANLGEWASTAWPRCDVKIVNDVKAAALAESTQGNLRDCDPGLYVNLGTGIAAAAVVGGEVVTGSGGLAGEIGYAPSSGSAITGDPDASLEVFAGGIGFDRAGIRVPSAPSAAWWETEPGKGARQRLDELVRHLSVCTLLLAPGRVVIGGGMSANPAIIDYIKAGLTRICVSKPRVLASHFGPDASLTGALIAATS